MTKLVLSLILCAGALLADVTGKWSGSFDVTGPDGETKAAKAYLVLKQDGNTITGTAGPSEDEQFPIRTGVIDENRITMEAEAHGDILKFELTLDGDHIRGTVKGEHEGKSMMAKLDVTRSD